MKEEVSYRITVTKCEYTRIENVEQNISEDAYTRIMVILSNDKYEFKQ